MSTDWARALAAWAIPDEILAAAPQSPWILPVALFQVNGRAAETPSHTIAREAVPESGSVLDVGCGGGRAALAVVPPATSIVGFDARQEMLDEFAAAAERRGVAHREVLGEWPRDAASAPVADVVVCHHLVYNVPDLTGLALALANHARNRVVIELPISHPLSWMAPLWEELWGVTRPSSPTAADAFEIITEAGLPARLVEWDEPAEARRPEQPWDDVVRDTRIRLCLPADRDADVGAALARVRQEVPPRRNATIWWRC